MVDAAGTGKGVRIDYLWSSYNCGRRILQLGRAHCPCPSPSTTIRCSSSTRPASIPRTSGGWSWPADAPRQRSGPASGSRPSPRRSRRSPACTTRPTSSRCRRWPRTAEAGSTWTPPCRRESYEAALLAAGAGLMAVDRALRDRAEGLHAGAAAGPSRLPEPGHGLLPVQQHRRGGGPRPGGAGAGAGAHRRLGRPPRQRHAGHVLRRAAGALLQHPRGRPLSRHGHGPGGRRAATRPGTRSTCRCRPAKATGRCCRRSTRCSAPLARAFKPQLVLVSAGYDPQAGDPLGDLRFSRTSFQWMAARLGPDG